MNYFDYREKQAEANFDLMASDDSDDVVGDMTPWTPFKILDNILTNLNNQFNIINYYIDMVDKSHAKFKDKFKFNNKFYDFQFRLFQNRQFIIELSSVTFKYKEWPNHFHRLKINTAAHGFRDGFDQLDPNDLQSYKSIQTLKNYLQRKLFNDINPGQISLLLEYSKRHWRFDISFVEHMDNEIICHLKICFNGQWRNPWQKINGVELRGNTEPIFDEDSTVS